MGALEGIDMEICTADGTIDLERSILVAEVYSRATQVTDQGLIASYFLAHSMDAAVAERAMNFFADQPGLIVDTAALVDDCGAEFPALVTIRWTDETKSYLATVHHYDMLRELPYDEVVRRDGFELFASLEALASGREAPEARPMPPFDYRALRRKIYALRCAVLDDRDPWLQRECFNLRRVTEGEPEGCETLIARADDMEQALKGEVAVGDGFSVVVPTIVERQRPAGAIMEWIPQTGHEIVVAHGLDAVQAAHALHAVKADPEAFVSKNMLVRGTAGREIVSRPFVVRDTGLNWIVTDLQGRRNSSGHDRLRRIVAGEIPVLGADSATRDSAGRRMR